MNKPTELIIQGHSSKLANISNSISEAVDKKNEQRYRINSLIDELNEIANLSGTRINLPNKYPPYQIKGELDELITASAVIPPDRRKELEQEIFNSVPAFPPFDKFDLFLIISLSGLVLLADWFIVGLPPKTKWTPKTEGGLIPTGWLSERLKAFSTENNNWLAQICKVPFDKTNIPDSGFNPYNHRALSFGHDPSPVGMVFGLIDICSGGMSGITRDGELFHIPGVPPAIGKILMAPLLWLGHLASDVATPLGLPVPGWSLTQLLRIPAPGAPGEATIADVGRIMYEQGYDFRHYLSGAFVPAMIEIVIRTYHFVRYKYPMKVKAKSDNLISNNLAENYIDELNINGHLNAMLFWSHATAAAVNAGKVAVQGSSTQNYFAAVRAINVIEWQMFAIRTVKYLTHRFRNKTIEQVVKNRKMINQRWEELSSNHHFNYFFKSDDAPILTICS